MIMLLLLLKKMLVMGLGQKHELYSRAKPEAKQKICVVVKDKLLLCKLIKLNQLSKQTNKQK